VVYLEEDSQLDSSPCELSVSFSGAAPLSPGCRGCESVPSPSVMSMSTTSTALRREKKLVTCWGHLWARRNGPLRGPALFFASSEEFVLFRLRCSRNSPTSGADGAADEAIDSPSDRNRSKFTMPSSPQQHQMELSCTAHYTSLPQTPDTNVKLSNQLFSDEWHQSRSVSQSVSPSWLRAPFETHGRIFTLYETFGFVCCGASSLAAGQVCHITSHSLSPCRM
jgi:hypothetical protein